jgi:hypothetical protein
MGSPSAVTHAGQVEGNDIELASKRRRNPVPPVRMASKSMDEQQQGAMTFRPA